MQTVGGTNPPPPPSWWRVDLDSALESARPKVERVLLAARVPPEDAEDLLQDVLTELFVRSDEIADPEAWLVSRVKWATLYYWRVRRRRMVDQLDEAISEQLSGSRSPSEDRLGLTHDLERQLRGLPTRCRRLLRMRYGLGFEPCEIAEEMGYQAESMRKVTRRCLDSLAVRLSRGGYGEEAVLHG